MREIKFQLSNFKWMLSAGWAVPILVWIVMFPGCAKKPESNPKTSKEPSAMRIISMAPNLTEILFALGLDEEIVGVTKQCTWPPAAKEKACVGGFWQPNIEAMLALRPTLVVNLWFDQQAAVVSRLEHTGCKVLTLRIETVEQLYEAIHQVGRTIGKPSAAEAMVQRLKDKQAQIATRYANRPKPKVLWVVQREPFCVAGTNTFINELIEMAGGVNAVGPTQNQYPRISTEKILLSAPDVIIEPVMDLDQTDAQHATAAVFYERFGSVPAVQNGRIHVVDGDIVSRLGPRLDEAAELVAGCLWQE